MNKKYFIAGFALLFLVFSVGILFYSKGSNQEEEGISESQIMGMEETTSEDGQVGEIENAEEEFKKEINNSENINEKSQIEAKEKEEETEQEEIELMDYAELGIEEFMEETGVLLCQDKEKENIWTTDDDVIRVRVDSGKIVGLEMDGVLCKEEAKKRIEKEGFPYTLAGISLNDEMSYIDGTILKDACHDDGMLNEEFYSSLYLSKLGIEMLQVVHDADKIGMVSAGFDQSLKDNSRHLEYIWTEQVRQKEGSRNDSLEIVQDPYISLPDRYLDSENIEKTIVWIKYPCLEIPGEPEMTENANETIQEAVKKIEDRTYRTTNESLILEADYYISYITGEFISISFTAQIKDRSGTKFLWQYCNINMKKKGKKAYISDVGISKEKIVASCKAGHELGEVDAEGYLENYNINWDQYNISPKEYRIIVRLLPEEEVNWQFGEPVCTLSVRKTIP